MDAETALWKLRTAGQEIELAVFWLERGEVNRGAELNDLADEGALLCKLGERMDRLARSAKG